MPASSQGSVASSESSFFALEQAFVRGEKIKLPFLTNTLTSGTEARYSQLATADGSWVLLVTNTVINGSFGKVRWVVDSEGQDYADKEFRAFDDNFPPPSQMSMAQFNKKTQLTEDYSVIAEATLTQKLRDAIEAYCEPFNDPHRAQRDSLAPLRDKVHPFCVHKIIELEPIDNVKKVHVIMSRESGDAFTAAEGLARSVQKAFTLSLAAQGYTELAALHDAAHHAHFDIKLENICFHHDGQLKLMDFGLAQDISQEDHIVTHSMLGSLIAPEFFGTQNPHLAEPRVLTSALDVWCMALTVAEAANGQTANPLIYIAQGDHKSSPEQLWQRAEEAYTDFVHFRQSLMSPKGEIRTSAIKKGSLMGDFFYPLATQNPALCKILLEQALVPEPDLRTPARALAPVIRRLVGQPDAPDFARLRADLKRLAEADEAMAGLRKAAQRAQQLANG
jgi:serine/threonine protein kinase